MMQTSVISPVFSRLLRGAMYSSAMGVLLMASPVRADVGSIVMPDCATSQGNASGVCEITTTGQNYTVTGEVVSNNNDWAAIWVHGASVASLTIENGAALRSEYSGLQIGQQYYLEAGANATIGTLTNYGTIQETNATGAALANGNGSTIDHLVNMGTIEGAEGSIFNQGIINTITNAQTNLNYYTGGWTSAGKNNLPANYYTYFTDATTYGKVAFAQLNNAQTALSYGIAGTGFEAGEVYQDVMTFDEDRTTAITLKPYFGVDYELLDRDGDGRYWDLKIIGLTVGGGGGGGSSPTRVVAASGNHSNNPAMAAAHVIDNTPALTTLFSGLSTDKEISDAATQTLPLMAGGTSVAAGQALSGMNKVIQARAESASSGISSGDEALEGNMWAKPFASKANQEGDNGIAGYDADIYGLVIGADKPVNDALRVGAAFGYGHADIKSDSNIASQKSDVSLYQLIGYGSYKLAPGVEANFQVDAGMNQNKGRRDIAFTGTTAESDYNSFTGHVAAGIAKTHKLNDSLSFIPSARADYSVVHDEDYSETGAGVLNLSVDDNTTHEIITSLDSKLTYALNGHTSINGNVGVGYDVLNDTPTVRAAFAGAPTASFETSGLDASPWIGRAGVGVIHSMDETLELNARYDTEVRKDFDNHTISFKLRKRF